MPAPGADRMSPLAIGWPLGHCTWTADHRRELSEGVSPGYEPRALEMLRASGDAYASAHRPRLSPQRPRPARSTRVLWRAATTPHRPDSLHVSPSQDLSPSAARPDLATITVKYTSPTRLPGPRAGDGRRAGQQPVHAPAWPRKVGLWFLAATRPCWGCPSGRGPPREQNNAIDLFFIDDLIPAESRLAERFRTVPRASPGGAAGLAGPGGAWPSVRTFLSLPRLDRRAPSGVRYVPSRAARQRCRVIAPETLRDDHGPHRPAHLPPLGARGTHRDGGGPRCAAPLPPTPRRGSWYAL